jgi:DNA polymerase III subunit gamma/tau
VICARLLLPSASDAESALLQRVERIETRLEMSIPLGDKPERPAPVRRSVAAAPPPPVAPAEPEPEPIPPAAAAAEPAPAPEPVPAQEDPVVAGSAEPNAAAVRTLWPTVRDKVRQRSRTTEVMLSGATVRAVEGNTLVLSHESAPLAKRLSEQRNADVIAEALKDALGVDWRVRCEAGAASPAAEAPVAPPPPVERPARRMVPPPPPPTEAPADAETDDRAEEESMLAEAGQDDTSTPRRDPEEAALELLQSELGARRIDNG